MQIHQLKPSPRKTRKRVGRGGKRGTYSGRGMKGQGSRAGARFQPLVRTMFKRYPKLRGYNFSPNTKRLKIAINVSEIENGFEKGVAITPAILHERGIISTIGKRMPDVKILGTGRVTKAFTLSGIEVSAVAKEKIEKAGGSVTVQ